MLKKTIKSKVISQSAVHKTDTGSAEVQIALFTQEIETLSKHLKIHQKDNSSRLGLLKMVAKRRRLLNYLKEGYPRRYNKTVKKLGLK